MLNFYNLPNSVNELLKSAKIGQHLCGAKQALDTQLKWKQNLFPIGNERRCHWFDALHVLAVAEPASCDSNPTRLGASS